MKRILSIATLMCGLFLLISPSGVRASGGGGGEKIKVSKCYFMQGATSWLIKAASSNVSAHLSAWGQSGEYFGEVSNGIWYGGTAMPYLANDPIWVTIKSDTGASVTVHTTPFQP